MENVEDIVESKASVEEICKYIQEHNTDKKSIKKIESFKKNYIKSLVKLIFHILALE